MKTKEAASPCRSLRRCIIIGNRRSVQALMPIVSNYFHIIDCIEAPRETDRLSTVARPDLLLATDCIDGGLTPLQLKTVKLKLRPRVVICLVKRIDAQIEISLRAVGLIFLGTHEQFLHQADAILAFAKAKDDLPDEPTRRESAPARALRNSA